MQRLALVLLAAAVAISCQQPLRRTSLEAAPPAAQGEVVYVSDDLGRIHAVGRDGRERWAYGFGEVLERESRGATRDVAVVDIATAEDGSVVALLASETGVTAGETFLVALTPDGVERWHRSVDRPTPASRPVAVGRDVYVALADGTLHAYALADGHDLWTFAVSGAALGSPHVASDGTIYVRGANGRVHAVAPDGTQLWVFGPQ